MSTFDFPHRGRAQTARIMYWLAQQFRDDLQGLGRLPLLQFYDFVRKIPYAPDDLAWGDPQRELIARPSYLLGWQRFPGLDCKKKAILLGAWAEKNGVPWELIGMSEEKDRQIHHVFPVLFNGARFVNADATYPHYSFGQPKPEMTAAERFFR